MTKTFMDSRFKRGRNKISYDLFYWTDERV